MLNIPHKSQLMSEVSESKLDQLISLRKKVNQLEQLIEQIMPSAINEAGAQRAFGIDILSNESAINGKNVVYSQKDKGKITVTFRKQYPSVKDSVVLQRLDDEIKAEQKSLTIKYQTQLSDLDRQRSELNETMELLETEKKKLMTNKRLINLKKRFTEERENGMELVPNLSVYIDK